MKKFILSKMRLISPTIKKFILSKVKLILSRMSFTNKKRLIRSIKYLLLSLGFIVHGLMNLVCNAVLAPFFGVYFDFHTALVLMYITNLTKTGILVYVYDFTRRDWFFIESFKEVGSTQPKKVNHVVKKIQLVLSKLEKRGKTFTHCVLMLVDNTFGILYIRDGFHKYNGVPKEVQKVFLFGIFMSSLGIILSVFGIFSIFPFFKILFLNLITLFLEMLKHTPEIIL